MAAILRNLPKQLTNDLALELRKLSTVDEVRNAVNIYRHDYRTGMPRGMTGPMLCAAEQTPDTKTDAQTSNTQTTTQPNAQQAPTQPTDLNAASKDGKERAAKGYGKCWGCGEWGHPRRECPEFLKRMGKGGDVAALKGSGKNKGKRER